MGFLARAGRLSGLGFFGIRPGGPAQRTPADRSWLGSGHERRALLDGEVICKELPALLARDRAVDNWLACQVGPAFDALNADRSRDLTTQVRAHQAAPLRSVNAQRAR